MSLSRRDFLKFSGATAAGVAAGTGIDLAPVEAAATSLKIKEAKAFAGVCPYCAVGCGQLIYARDNKIIDIEGNPDTPHTLGRLCPKGAATIQLSNNPLRPTRALYRAAGSETSPKPLPRSADRKRSAASSACCRPVSTRRAATLPRRECTRTSSPSVTPSCSASSGERSSVSPRRIGD